MTRHLTHDELEDVAEYLQTAGCGCTHRTILWKVEEHALIAMCATCLRTVVLPDNETVTEDGDFYHA